MTLVHPHGPGWKVLGESCKVEVRGEHSLAPGSCAGPCAAMMMTMMMMRMMMRMMMMMMMMMMNVDDDDDDDCG